MGLPKKKKLLDREILWSHRKNNLYKTKRKIPTLFLYVTSRRYFLQNENRKRLIDTNLSNKRVYSYFESMSCP